MISTDWLHWVRAGLEPNLLFVHSAEGGGEENVAKEDGAQEPGDHQEARPAEIGSLPHFMIGLN